MANNKFGTLSKNEAIKMMLGDAGNKINAECNFVSEKGDIVKSRSVLFLEGIDFDLTYFPLKHLGYKCVVAATGELFAAMGRVKTLTVRIGVSSRFDFEEIKELWTGMVSAAEEFGYSGMDLDLNPSQNGLAIALSATGITPKSTEESRPVAQSKDLVCISGSLGAAFLGMNILDKKKREFDKSGDDNSQPDLEKYKMMIGAYLKPELNPATVSLLENGNMYPSYGYCVKKGLADAVKQLTEDSGFGVKIYADKIPFEGNSFSFGKEMDIDPISAAMNGGEDYRLLFTIPIMKAEAFRHDFQTFDIIGHLAQKDVGAVLVTPDGLELPIKAQGWNNEEDTEQE
ncbi:MAG: thiamine-phosphate kinase [Bacteroidales bacterium]|jgi:thiamine-monophosphate kinase|nr:thiamine-phosphate kinase [Bacteroidales bacterium]